MNDARYIADRLYRELCVSGDAFVLSRDQMQQIVSLIDQLRTARRYQPRSDDKLVKKLREQAETIEDQQVKIYNLQQELKEYEGLGPAESIRSIKGTF